MKIKQNGEKQMRTKDVEKIVHKKICEYAKKNGSRSFLRVREKNC